MIVLDTHVWLWHASDPGKLSHSAHAAIETAERIGVCTISCWEVAMLVERGRIELDRAPRQWIRLALAQEGVVSLPLTAEIAVEAAFVGRAAPSPADPADRIIYATARASGSPLVTKDAGLRDFDPQGTVW